MTRKPELESALEDRCAAKVEALGGVALKLVILGQRGFPDRTLLMPGGHVWFAEFKRAKTGAVSKPQHRIRVLLNLLGFKVITIDNDADFDAALSDQL